MADGRRLERRRRDEREQPRHLREHLGRRLQRLVDLGLRASVSSSGNSAGRGLLADEQAVDVDAVAGLGRHPAGGGVRVGQEPEPLELGELGADRRGRDVEAGALDEQPRADRRARRDVLLDDAREDLALALGELGAHRRPW